jgi:DNA-binding response OmpR family regulator
MRVLVIDDDPAMTELLKIQLQSEEVIVESAASGEEGLLLIKKSNPDIIILDLLMPELDGWQTCKKIRAICQVPILILSAINNPALIATALDSGADDYLVKPVSTNILNAYLQKLSRRSRLNSDCYRHVSV